MPNPNATSPQESGTRWQIRQLATANCRIRQRPGAHGGALSFEPPDGRCVPAVAGPPANLEEFLEFLSNDPYSGPRSRAGGRTRRGPAGPETARRARCHAPSRGACPPLAGRTPGASRRGPRGMGEAYAGTAQVARNIAKSTTSPCPDAIRVARPRSFAVLISGSGGGVAISPSGRCDRMSIQSTI